MFPDVYNYELPFVHIQHLGEAKVLNKIKKTNILFVF